MDEMIREQLSWLGGLLPEPAARVLDAGCGRGELAGGMAEAGYEVVAIDDDLEAVEEARVNGVPAIHSDLITYETDRPFDAVLFSFSLHHIHPLTAAVERAAALLRPGGVIVADEFAWERADRAAAAWFYDTAAVLAAGGLLDRVPSVAVADPFEAWCALHNDHHTGAAMTAALRSGFGDVSVTPRPYLARFLGGVLTDGARPVAAELRRIEERRVADGDLPMTGRRMVARES